MEVQCMLWVFFTQNLCYDSVFFYIMTILLKLGKMKTIILLTVMYNNTLQYIESHCIMRFLPKHSPVCYICCFLKWPHEVGDDCYYCGLFGNYFLITPVVFFPYSPSHLAVCFTAWWCWRGHMIWYFRKGTVLPLLSRIQWRSHSLAGRYLYCDDILQCNITSHQFISLLFSCYSMPMEMCRGKKVLL